MRQKLVTRIMSFVEANCDFQVVTDNIFTVNIELSEEPNPSMKQRQQKELLRRSSLSHGVDVQSMAKNITFRRSLIKRHCNNLVSQLMTVCSSLYEDPLIFAHKNSQMSS